MVIEEIDRIEIAQTAGYYFTFRKNEKSAFAMLSLDFTHILGFSHIYKLTNLSKLEQEYLRLKFS